MTPTGPAFLHLIWGAAFGAMPTLVHEDLQESVPDDLASEV